MADETDDKPLELPDATRMQVVALVQAAIAVAVAFGVPISDQQSVALIALAGVVATVLITADAAIRRERSRNAEKLRPRATISTTITPEGTETKATVSGALSAADGDDFNQRVIEHYVRTILEREQERRTAVGQPEPAPDGETRRRGGSKAVQTRKR